MRPVLARWHPLPASPQQRGPRRPHPRGSEQQAGPAPAPASPAAPTGPESAGEPWSPAGARDREGTAWLWPGLGASAARHTAPQRGPGCRTHGRDPAPTQVRAGPSPAPTAVSTGEPPGWNLGFSGAPLSCVWAPQPREGLLQGRSPTVMGALSPPRGHQLFPAAVDSAAPCRPLRGSCGRSSGRLGRAGRDHRAALPSPSAES